MKKLLHSAKRRIMETIVDGSDFAPQIHEYLNSVIKLDKDGNLLSFNQAFATQYGYCEQDFTKPFAERFFSRQFTKWNCFFNKAKSGEIQEFEAEGYCKKRKAMGLHVTLIPCNNKADADVLVVVKNIEKYKRQQKEILLYKKEISILNEMERICSFYYDAINDRYFFSKKLPGIHWKDSTFSLSYNQFLQFVHPDDRASVDYHVFDALKNKNNYEMEYRLLRKDGSVSYVYERAEIFLDQNGYFDGLIGYMQDITDNKIPQGAKTKRMIGSEQFYRSLFENNFAMIFYLDTYGLVAKTNGKVSEILGCSEEEVLFRSIADWLPPSETSLYQPFLQKVLSGERKALNTVILPPNGEQLPVHLEGVPVLSDDQVIGAFMIAEDRSEVKTMEVQLNEAELKYKSLIEQAFIGVFILEQSGHISYANLKFFRILGIADHCDVNIWDYIHQADQQGQKLIWKHLMQGEDGVEHSFRMIKKDGAIIDIEAHSKKVVLKNNQPVIISVIQDVTERKKAEDLNRYLAYHDPLTTLPNRRMFREKLAVELDKSKALKRMFAVLYLDLDRFRYVNDTLGYPVGDQLLKQVSLRIKGNLKKEVVLARLGGDEFAILLSDIANREEVIDFSKKLIKTLEKPFYVQDYELFITASIGISIFPTDGEDVGTIAMHADSALNKAKDSGTNTFHIYTPSMDIESYRIFTLQSDLRKALEGNELELYYQPQICAHTQQILGAEALIRWNHPKWGLVSPGEFIPIAEETGLILEMEEWVKETACRQIKAWQEAGLRIVPVSINLTARRFLDKDLLENMQKILIETNLDPKYLAVEITESSLLQNEKMVLSVLDGLRELGIRISLDDFGTGYSSLSYLKRFKGRIDVLKIDSSFIRDLSKTEQEEENVITKTIIELAHYLKMDVVAEGVETVEQLEILKEFRCNKVQGYLFSKPVPAKEFAVLLQKEKMEAVTHSFREKKKTAQTSWRFSRKVLKEPLQASMTLVKIHGKNVQLGSSMAVIEEMGLGCMKFSTNLRLAIHKDILLEFETEIFGVAVKLYGHVIWMEELKSDLFHYELEFSKKENDHFLLLSLLKELDFGTKGLDNCQREHCSKFALCRG